MTSETSITNAIRKHLLALDGCYCIKIHVTSYVTRGTPDILGCFQGRMFALEVKRPGNKPTPIQRVELERWAAAGAITAVVHSVEEAVEAVTGGQT